MQPNIRAMNGAILDALMQEVTGHPVLKSEREAVWKKGKRWLLSISALGEYPWIMPYALALLQDKHERNFPSGGTGFLAYRDFGRQFLPYTRVDDLAGSAGVPEYLQLNWVNTLNGKTHYRPFLRNKTDPVIFEFTQEASMRLAQRRNGLHNPYGRLTP